MMTMTGNAPSNTGCPTTNNRVGCKGYELAGDIDLSSFANFAPIGSDSNSFTTILEGNDYTISNLNIATTTHYTGLFAVLGNNSTVKNLSFAKSTTASVASSNDSGALLNPNRVGVLAGSNSGTISGVSSGISVSASVGTFNYVGGLVGQNYISGTIQDSYATGDATGSSGNLDRVGGLVGYNESGTIGNSYATGSADGGAGDNDSVGGLVGTNLGTIGNSYATGSAKGGAGDDSVGGLVGRNRSGILGGATIKNSYALGKVDGGDGADEVGRLLGKKGSGSGTITITSNYYNSESDLDNGETILILENTEAVAKTRDELKALTATDTEDDFAGDNNGWSTDDWDFTAEANTPL